MHHGRTVGPCVNLLTAMDEDYFPEEQETLQGELDEARDNYARSDEDGWFYPDED